MQVLRTHFLEFPLYQLKDYSQYDQYIQYYKQQSDPQCIPLLIQIAHKYLHDTCYYSLFYKIKFLLELIQIHLLEFSNDFLSFLHEKLVFFCKNKQNNDTNNGLEHILQIQSFLLLSKCVTEDNIPLYFELCFHAVLHSHNGYVKQSCCSLFYKLLPYKEQLEKYIPLAMETNGEEWIDFLYLFLNHYTIAQEYSSIFLPCIPWNQLSKQYHHLSFKCIFIAKYFNYKPLFSISNIKELSYAIQLFPINYVKMAQEYFVWDNFYLEQILEPLLPHCDESFQKWFLEKICKEFDHAKHFGTILLFLNQYCNHECLELVKQNYTILLNHSSKNLELLLTLFCNEKEWILKLCQENLIENWNWEMRDTIITFLKKHDSLLLTYSQLQQRVVAMIATEIEPYVKLNCFDLIPIVGEEEIFSNEEFWNRLQMEDFFLKTKVLELIQNYNSSCIELIESIYNQMEWEIYPHCCRVLAKWGLQYESLYQNLQKEYEQQKALQELHHESQEWIQRFSPKQDGEEEQDCHYA